MSTYNPYNQDMKHLDEVTGNAPPSSYVGPTPAPERPVILVQPQAVNVSGGVGIPIANVGPKPMETNCPHCRCRITTKVSHRSTVKTHIACLLLMWTLCCCCLPYCMDTCRNANHYCPMCGAYIGTYAS